MAGMIAENVLEGRVEQAHWHEVATLDPERAVLLDVRSAGEREDGFIPGSIHIPLPEMRERIEELPRDKEIVVYCRSGQRSYTAARILAQRGFRVRNLSGAYLTWEVATGG